MSGVKDWSQTAASNATADPAVNWAEGQAPSTVNDSSRAEMASIAKWRDDISGSLLTTGTSTAYALTTNEGFSTLANMNGMLIAFTPHVTNGGTCTINIDSLGAKALRPAPSVEFAAGDIIAGTPYVATYFNSTGEVLIHDCGDMPTHIPLGSMIDYTGSSAPNSRFVFPFGQAISRTTYANYFTLVSTAFGVGDGSTTFNVPDLRGRTVFGKDDMGGSAASRITSGVSGITGATLGASGGAQSATLTVSNMPAHSHTTEVIYQPNIGGVPIVSAFSGGSTYAVNAGTANFVFPTSSYFTVAGLDSIFTSSSAGSGTAFSPIPPGIVLNKILRVQ